MAQAKTLHVCHVNRNGPKLHACRKAHDALDAAGHSYETNVFDKNRPFGLFTHGKRPELKRMTGQEKLPVLELDDGSMITGSGDIVAWAQRTPPGA
jgi:glutathione S-transferase